MKPSRKRSKDSEVVTTDSADYGNVLAGVVDIIEAARRSSARAVNSAMTSAYWRIGRLIVECEQGGADRAEYGKAVIQRLSQDLTNKFGRGFGYVNLTQMRRFFMAWPDARILQTASEESSAAQKLQTSSEVFGRARTPKPSDAATPLPAIQGRFPLPWSHYVLLLKVEKPAARSFYEAEALRCGWSVRQLDRQISTLFYERTLASRNKGAMLKKGGIALEGESLAPEQELKDPLVLEFLGLKDEYSESDLEEALIQQLESFLLELGGDFTFVGRQKRLRVDDEWYRVDLVFFHRALRCLVVIDLKVGRFTHADAGQMLLYLGYAAEHWTRPGENPPVGLILCAQHNHAVAHYTLDRLSDKVMASEYRVVLPDEKTLVAELQRTQELIESRKSPNPSIAKTRQSQSPGKKSIRRRRTN